MCPSETDIAVASMPDEEAAQLAYDLMKAIPRNDEGNPLTLEGAIRSVILKSPDMHQYRDFALSTIYCVLGAGIRWDKDGRLGDCCPNNYMNMPPQAGGQGCWSREHGFDESVTGMRLPNAVTETFREAHRRTITKAKATILNIDLRCQQCSPTPVSSWYPVSWYGCNLAAPANAQPDFFYGALETAELIVEARPPLGTEAWMTHQQTKSYAAEILSALHHRAIHGCDAPLDGVG